MAIENISSENLSSLEETRVRILEAGRQAFESLVKEFDDPDALTALSEEWKAFERYISTRGTIELELIQALPYRRVLTPSESKQLRHTLAARWNVDGYWYPLSEVDPSANVIAFHAELWDRRDGTETLLGALEQRAVGRCFAVLEGPSDYELDRSLVDAMYRDHETFITSDFEWLVYSSHESSITVAGWLADFFRSQWRDWTAVTYQGPFHTADLRGSWRSA